MFNLERANQFFMLIMNRPAVPASLFMEQEQARVPGQAPWVISALGVPASRGVPQGPCLCHFGSDSLGVCACVCACVCHQDSRWRTRFECVCVHTCVEGERWELLDQRIRKAVKGLVLQHPPFTSEEL